MGGYLHPAHKQCPKSHSVHSDHAALQGDPAAGLDQLQAAAAITQQPPGPSPFLYLAGNVASSWKQPECSLSRVPGTSLWDVLHLKDLLADSHRQAKQDTSCYTGILHSHGPITGLTHLFVCLLRYIPVIVHSFYWVTNSFPMEVELGLEFEMKSSLSQFYAASYTMCPKYWIHILPGSTFST